MSLRALARINVCAIERNVARLRGELAGGADGGDRQTAEQLARRTGTINYEIVCGISNRVRRSYDRDDGPLMESPQGEGRS